jgi:AcrR family transcriptional regulator
MTATRPYHSPRRAQGAATTRQDVLDAARRLFLERGYAQVTVADIAREAGTAVKTVYASAGGKAEILREVVGTAVTNSGAQETVDRARTMTDGKAVLAELARGTGAASREQRDAIVILLGALPTHESAEALWEEGTTLYHRALRDIADHLAALGALRDGMDVQRCADLLWLCFGLNAWRTLVEECGWEWDAARDQLTDMATSLLLRA